MSRRDRPSSQANLLRAEGVPALGTIEFNGNHTNPIGFYNPDKGKYVTIWSKYDFDQCVARYKWEGLPNGITSWNLERMLYFRGSLAGARVAGKEYILPYVISGEINPYGMPTEITLIPYNGNPTSGGEELLGKEFTLPVDANGNENDDYGAVILYDSVPFSPSGQSPSRYFLNQIIIKEMADTFARVNINIVVSNKKIMLQCKDAKQAEVMRKEIEMAFASDSPFAVITSPLESQTIQSTSDYNADELFNTIKNYDAIRCFMSGISSKNFGTEKKERLVSGELQGNEEQKDLVLDMGLEMRQLFADMMNKKFGTNISVSKRSDEYEEMVNGNGNTKLDEEGEL